MYTVDNVESRINGHGYYLLETYFKKIKAMSLKNESGYFIGIDPSKIETSQEKAMILLHECVHCELNAFYNEHSALDIRQKHENRVDKKIISELIDYEEIASILDKYGDVPEWELAEDLDVPQELIHKALHYYKYGNLAC